MNTNDIHITLPASKSLSNRWLVLNHLLGGPFILHNLSKADDTMLLQALLNQLQHKTGNVFYCGNAGTVSRFMLAILAITPGQWTLSGDDRLKERPIAPLVDSLRSMGCKIEYTEKESHLPVSITGTKPQRKMAEVDPSASSQFVSALLLIGAVLPNGITVTLTDRASSRPYIEMTINVLKQAGFETFISPNNRVYRIGERLPLTKRNNTLINIEHDWSSASYIYAAAALLPGVRFRMQGLSLTGSLQGDKVAAEIFEHLGVTTREVRSPYRSDVRSIVVVGSGIPEKSLEYNFIDCPDLLPAVLVTCAAMGVKAKLKGVKNLRVKESDRLKALQNELLKMNGKMTCTSTETRIIPSELHPTESVNTYNDHRIAMSFGILSLKFPELIIEQPEQVSKSFPNFWEQLTLIRKAADLSRLNTK